MSVVKLHQERKPARRDTGADRARTHGSDIPFALVAVALMIAGVALGGAQSARQDLLQMHPAATSPEVMAVQFDYFPSHYVNQGVEPSQEYPTF